MLSMVFQYVLHLLLSSFGIIIIILLLSSFFLMHCGLAGYDVEWYRLHGPIPRLHQWSCELPPSSSPPVCSAVACQRPTLHRTWRSSLVIMLFVFVSSLFLFTTYNHIQMIIDPGISIHPGYSVYDQLMESQAYVRSYGSSQPIVGKVWPGNPRSYTFSSFMFN